MSCNPLHMGIAELNGHAVAIWPDHSIDASVGQKHAEGLEADSGSPFVAIANMRTPLSFLSGLEAFSVHPFSQMGISTFMTARKRFSQTNAETLLDSLGYRPTPARLKQARECMDIWGEIPNADESLSHHDLCYYAFLDSLAEAASDLKAAFTLYAYGLGQCSCEMVEASLSRGFFFTSELYPGTQYDSYLRYIERLDKEGYRLLREWDEQDWGKRSLMGKEKSESIQDARDYGRTVFNLFFRDATPRIMVDDKFYPSGYNTWGSAYVSLAESLCSGHAGVCDYCGSIFLSRRNTRRFCSNSCKVAANKKKHADD